MKKWSIALLALLSVVLVFVITSCVPQHPSLLSVKNIYDAKLKILNSAGPVLLDKVEGTVIYVSGSDAIIHDGQTGIYVYKAGFYSSDVGKKVTLTNVIGTTYRDSVQIDFSKGGYKNFAAETLTVEPTALTIDIANNVSITTRALWDFQYVKVYGILNGGKMTFTYEYDKVNKRKATINVASLSSSLSLPYTYDTEATLTGYLQFSNGAWSLKVLSAEIGDSYPGVGVFVDEVVDGKTFKVGEQTYELIGIDDSVNPSAAKTKLEEFINSQPEGIVQVLVKGEKNGKKYAFLFSKDGKTLYQEQALKDGVVVPNLAEEWEDAAIYELLKNAYKSAYSSKKGVYSTFSGASVITVESSNTYIEGNYAIFSGTVSDVTEDATGNVNINVSNWLKITISAGNFKYLFSSTFEQFKNSLEGKVTNFYGKAKRSEGILEMPLYAEWEMFSFESGSGTQDDPYIITKPEHLISVRALASANKYFRLEADIDLAGVDWTPIGTYSSNLSTSAFVGVFDGNGHKIMNISFNDTTKSNVGLFGYLYNATVTNLIIENANITASSRAGALAGASKLSKIYRVKVVKSSVRVTYSGSGYGGGLIGEAIDGTEIEECAVRNTTVSGVKYAIGGLLGRLKVNSGQPAVVVKNCYVEGGQVSSDYSSTTASAGFICNFSATSAADAVIENNYVVASITNGKAFIAYKETGSTDPVVTSSYYDTQVVGSGVSDSYATGKTTSEMKQQATFSGWDFTNIWTIDEGNDYPRLKWEN